MTNPNVNYYISSGAKNAMRTLRRVSSAPSYYVDEYICNLSRDHDTAIEKARKICGNNTLYANYFDLNGWGENMIPDWAKKQMAAIEMGFMPFGKYKGQPISEMTDGYVKFWVHQTADSQVATVLVEKFTEIANERGLFEKWEREEQEKADAIANMEYVGTIGERMEFDVVCNMVLSFDGYYGTTYINICSDADGNEIVYRGTNSLVKGVRYQGKATVKEHKEYKGKPQTMVSRPAFNEVEEKLATV